MTRYWIGVVSQEHVQRGVQGNFCQVCHGKQAPLKKMQPGDMLIYYSPRTSYPAGEALQEFTAMGQVQSAEPYQVEMWPDFHPYRKDVQYLDVNPVPIHSIKEQLEFTHGNWGFQLRKGHFEISKHDFDVIAQRMGLSPEHLGNTPDAQ
ncbi:EVE domain-containing protein [Deinococcus cellulosilyticus]|uniref:UPF0310 protein DC3_27340 n=1 Tax=Deinococcus cellulosilyticus (strain DSM 18568 / NBRC 106333 / KACC 11606 / 5516J-15) TaxID=1223518 RepID=A0A511N2M2_DEIC1|nr:EVE domain-containing protein [Deinococcus cellulosilyticus]GEM47099.1 UPF0310 protein YdcG [Deinococcus cellulosilyticus NBRC 106333 = KACC 11606]